MAKEDLRPNKDWVKGGVSPNPNGRPKKTDTFSDIARELLQACEIEIEYTFPKAGKLVTNKLNLKSDKTFNHSLFASLLKESLDGNVLAIRELIDRTEGKAKQSIDHTTKGNEIKQNVYNILNSDQKAKIEDIHLNSDDI